MATYTYSSLTELREELKKKVEARTETRKEALMGIAVSHALDYLDIAIENHIILSLNANTAQNAGGPLVFLHRLNLSRGMSTMASRDEMVKKLGSYELFTIVNDLEEARMDINICVGKNGLYLQHLNSDGTFLDFDVYQEIEMVLKGFHLSSRKEEFLVHGTLQPFFQKLQEGFLKKMR